MTIKPQATVSSMFAQSVAVLTQPSVATFERFERRGGTAQAYTYVAVAALVSAIVAGFFGLFHQEVNALGQFVARFVVMLVGFGVFTGLVYAVGRYAFHGTGTYPEVAYTYALFYVPIAVVAIVLSALLGVLGWIVAWPLALVNVFFGFLAVQSSMNIRDPLRAGITLVLAGLGLWLINGNLERALTNLLVR